jgi:hypothetical protein
MGLDITAVRRAKAVPACDKKGDCYPQHHYIYPIREFVERADGLERGCYESDEDLAFRAGSYSSYNRWREWLSQTFIGVSPERVWQSPTFYADKPFVELVNFSDAEGVIGPMTSAKLAQDFRAHLPEVDAMPDDFETRLYRRWMYAFEMAADNGFVKFH